jgi:hypothetical protein
MLCTTLVGRLGQLIHIASPDWFRSFLHLRPVGFEPGSEFLDELHQVEVHGFESGWMFCEKLLHYVPLCCAFGALTHDQSYYMCHSSFIT